jgi:hypothetical protein
MSGVVWFVHPKLRHWTPFFMRPDCDRSYFKPCDGTDESLYDAIIRYQKAGLTIMLPCSPVYHPDWKDRVAKKRWNK